MSSQQPETAAGIPLTQLGPVDRVDDGTLTDIYTYPDGLRTCWVRGNMIVSLDGGATDKGKAGGLAGPGDRAVFALMRDAADVILVGAATVRIENYSGAQLSIAQREARRLRGQSEVPPIAVVTQSGDLDPSSLLFTRTEAPPLILTCTRSSEAIRRRLGSLAEVIDASGQDAGTVDPAVALKVLAERRLFRVLTEGGPLFLGLLIEQDLLDELCLTIAPILVGGSARRIVTGLGSVHSKMRRTHLLGDDEGYLYSRYVKSD